MADDELDESGGGNVAANGLAGGAPGAAEALEQPDLDSISDAGSDGSSAPGGNATSVLRELVMTTPWAELLARGTGVAAVEAGSASVRRRTAMWDALVARISGRTTQDGSERRKEGKKGAKGRKAGADGPAADPLPDALVPNLLDILFSTLPRYQDRASRAAAARAVAAIASDRDLGPKALPKLVMGLDRVRTSKAAASSDGFRFSLLFWSLVVVPRLVSLLTSSDSSVSQDSLKTLLTASAELAATLPAKLGSQAIKLFRSAVARSKVAGAKTVLACALALAKGSADLKWAPLVGACADVAEHKKWDIVGHAEAAEIVAYWATAVLGAKAPVPEPQQDLLAAVFRSFASNAALDPALPLVEKAYTRAAEQNGLATVRALACIPNGGVNLSAWLTKLTVPITANLKSAVAGTRRSAVLLFGQLTRLSPAASHKSALDTVNKLLASKLPSWESRAAAYEALGSLPPGEASKGVLDALLPLLAGKETHDQSVAALLSVVAPHLAEVEGAYAKAGEAIVAVVGNAKTAVGLRKACIVGLAQVLPPVAVGNVPAKIVEALAGALAALLVKLQAAGAGWMAKEGKEGFFVEVLAGLAWLLRWSEAEGDKGAAATAMTKAKVLPTLLGAASARAFLLSEKLYSRALPVEADQLQLVQLLSLLTRLPGTRDMVLGSADLPAAWAWCACQSSSWAVRRDAIGSLRDLARTAAERKDAKLAGQLAHLALRAAGGLLSSAGEPGSGPAVAAAPVEDENDDSRWPGAWPISRARNGKDIGVRSWELVRAAIPVGAKDDAALADALDAAVMSTLVISQVDAIAGVEGENAWPNLVHEVLAESAGSLIQRRGLPFVEKLLATESADSVPDYPFEGSLHRESQEQFRAATLKALSVVVRFGNDKVVSTLLSWSLGKIKGTDIADFGADDYRIWITPASELAFDPVAARRAKQAEKAAQSGAPRTKDEKFDAQLRKELAAKGKAAGATGQLNKEEKELQDAQFKKEAEVRAKADASVNSLRTAFSVLRAVIDAASELDDGELDEEDATETADALAPFMADLVQALLRDFLIGRVPAADPTGSLISAVAGDAVDAYVALADCAGWRLGAAVHPPRLQFATLQAHGIPLPGNPWKGTSLQDLLSSTLDRLESSASSPMPAASFIYLFPLLEVVLSDAAKVTSIGAKAKVDLVAKALAILASHCRSYPITTDPEVPTARMARVLIGLISRLATKFGADGREALMALCQGVGDSKLVRDDGVNGSAEEHQNGVDVAGHGSSIEVLEELLQGALSTEAASREAALYCMKYLDASENETLSARVDCALWCGKFEEGAVGEAASESWAIKNGEDCLDVDLLPMLLEVVTNHVEAIQTSAGKGLGAILELEEGEVRPTLDALYNIYRKEVAPPVPEYDEFGILIKSSLEKPDVPMPRCGLARALRSCAPAVSDGDDLQSVFRFLIYDEALGDKSEAVRKLMLEACLAIINAHGKENTSALLPVFDGYLEAPAKPSETHDRIREAIVVGLGTIAQHLASDDPHVAPILKKLLETLKTPSESVQMAVAECLPPLAKGLKDEAATVAAQLMDQLLNGQSYAERRGAAYGLAGLVKGRGIAALRDYNIMADLKAAIEDKKSAEKREGALLAYEMFSTTLGRLFEPYIIQVLPLVVPCFGDGKAEVREATWDTAKAIMGKISQHGVKLILPSLLTGLESPNWRSKVGSIEILGSMAFMAPKQLTASLPVIVPRLTDVLADTHIKVQEAARTALVHFGEVIRNPEIQFLVPILLNALVDPNNKTHSALTALLETAFVHYIDAPSLALVVPILKRGLRERSTDTKKRAAQIMGSMAMLTEAKDLLPYMGDLLPLLKGVLVDPVPETRAIAAKALGTVVQKLGEDNFPGLVGELIQILKSDSGSVDRSGAAQGLSEVLAGLDIDRFDGLLPEFVANTNSSRVYVREGFLTLFIYLPATFKERYVPYLPTVVPALLKGLADESESVRDVSLKAGQMVVRNYSSSAIDLLLPELERGIFDDNWRIRQSSITLLGDLLYRVTGVSGKAATDADEEMLGTEIGRRALVDTLGMERYQNVLARVYIVRNDVNLVVRSTSLHVWKSIVSNTPRAIKEILPVMMEILISSLGSESYDKRSVAGRTLADLVRKLGENVLQDIMPVFQRGLESDDPNVRQGVCIGMTEIMAHAGKAVIEEYAVQLVPLTQKALADSVPEIRTQAAKAFDMLQEHMGGKAVDEILPTLIAQLKLGDPSGSALEALKGIMAVKANVVLPTLLPTLLQKPITAFNARALASVLSVSGSAINRRIGTILPALMEALGQKDDAVPDIEDAIRVLLRSVEDDGVHGLVSLLSERISDPKHKERSAAAFVVSALFSESSADMSIYINDWISTLVPLLNDEDPTMVESSWRALDALTKSVKKDDLDRYVYQTRRAIASIPYHGDDAAVAGFSLPKGIAPLLAIFLQGLMYSSPDIREQSALGIGDIIVRTTPEGLKAFVTQITGPLIRIMGERVMPNVKGAMLQTITLLLDKVPGQLRPFLPQLQRTLTKSLTDPSPVVRDGASKALLVFVGLQSKLDPLVAEIVASARPNEERGVREATLAALVGLIRSLGPGRELSDASKRAIEKAIEDATSSGVDADAEIRVQAAKCLGAYVSKLPMEDAKALVSSFVFSPPANWTQGHAMGLMVLHIMRESPSFFADAGMREELIAKVDELCGDDKAVVAEAAIKAARAILAAPDVEQLAVDTLAPRMGSILVTDGKASDVKREALVAIKTAAKEHHGMLEPYIPSLVGPMFACVRDRNIPAKLAAERALMYAFNLKRKSDIPNSYFTQLDAATARSAADYSKRVLMRMAAEDESDADD
ncbi:armadillo-type protein [Hyaloraphidium curvatum]|nr:armadillo-type protein [Hyaloraphidium curvatum]